MVEKPVQKTAKISGQAHLGMFVLMAMGTVVGLTAIDLVLPALPGLPDALIGSPPLAQLVIASYVLGTAGGMLAFGSWAARMTRSRLLLFGFFGFALFSFICTIVDSIHWLIILRFFQGFAGAAPAVFAPAIIRALYSDMGAVRALSALGSVESLAPALAPILGAWLLVQFDWTASFKLTGAIGLLLFFWVFFVRGRVPARPPEQRAGSYGQLLRSPVFMRYVISHAMVLGGLLAFVFAMPAVIVRTMDGTLSHFVTMQVVGISLFILVTNLSGLLVQRIGAERVILSGTLLALFGAVALALYALWGDNDPAMLVYLFAPVNAGLGLRGPPGFLRAIMAGKGDDDRAASLMMLAISGSASGATAIVAPYIENGLLPVALICVLMQGLAVVALKALPELKLEQ